MHLLNVHAPIISGKSAAGFSIGINIQDLSEILDDARTVDYQPDFHLIRAVRENKGVLCIKGFGDGTSVYFGPDTVRLVFSSQGALGCIYLFHGYLGEYNGAKIGDPLSRISTCEPLEFDTGDEMYYRVNGEGEYTPGLAILSQEVSTEEFSGTDIYGFSVHDWSIFQKT